MSMTIVVVGVAVVAGWVSYWHAVDVVRRYGAEHDPAVYLIPLTIDGMIYASSMAMLWAARYDLKTGWLSWTALVVGIAATLGANVLQGMEKGALAAVIAAWPAVALVISYELMMWVVRSGRELADRQTTVQVVEPVGENGTGPLFPMWLEADRVESTDGPRPDHVRTNVVETVPDHETSDHVEDGPVVLSVQPQLPAEPERRHRTNVEDSFDQDRERLDRAREVDAEYRAETGRPISAEKLARTMRIGKSRAIELVRAVRAEVARETGQEVSA